MVATHRAHTFGHVVALTLAACSVTGNVGQVGDDSRTPSFEICGNGYDDDNNDRIDEDCICDPNETQSCWTGLSRHRGRGLCRDGVQRCNAAEFGGWGACVGSALPSFEVPGNELDEDCNGIVSNECLTQETLDTCRDRTDGNCNGRVGCDDPECAASPGCERTTRDAGACVPVATSEAMCADNIDQDCDGRLDCNDPDCFVTPLCVHDGEDACHDGVDNDGDQLTDCLDVDCERCVEGGTRLCRDREGNVGTSTCLSDAWEPCVASVDRRPFREAICFELGACCEPTESHFGGAQGRSLGDCPSVIGCRQ